MRQHTDNGNNNETQSDTFLDYEDEQMQEFLMAIRKIENIFCPKTYGSCNAPYKPRLMTKDELKEYNMNMSAKEVRAFLKSHCNNNNRSNLNLFQTDIKEDEAIEEFTDDDVKSLYPEQAKAFEMCIKPGNVFITGRAGTGKSKIINSYIKYAHSKKLKVVICAPTGIAALNIQGATLHRVFKAPVHTITDEKPSEKAVNTLIGTDVVIIDEISMCRVDLFEFVCKTIAKANSLRKTLIKLIVVGDFLQLPPVVTKNDKIELELYYGNIGRGYAFQSSYWEWCKFNTIILKDVIRQSNKTTCSALSYIRCGMPEAIRYFNQCVNVPYINDAIYVCARNKEAEAINLRRLSEIDSPALQYEAKTEGDVRESDKPTSETLTLKKGARVMTIINSDDYVNGEFGTVLITNNNSPNIIVSMDSGKTVCIEPYTWEVYDYAYDEKEKKINRRTIGTFTQLPIKLGYAITIHKAQGQTFEKMNLSPNCWDAGQLYVALSRIKNITNLHLTEFIQSRYLVTAKEVLDFYTNIVSVQNNTKTNEQH